MTIFKGAAGIEKLKKESTGKLEYFVKEIASQTVSTIVSQKKPNGELIVGSNAYPSKVGLIDFPDNDPGRFLNSWSTSQEKLQSNFERIGNSGGVDSISQALLLEVDLQKPVYIENNTEEARYIEEIGWSSGEFPDRFDYGWRDKSEYSPVEKTSEKMKGIVQRAFQLARAYGGKE